MTYQFYGWSWLPWWSRSYDEDFHIHSNFAGWGPVQLHWYSK